MIIDKNFCSSSFLVYRYIERLDVEFYPGLKHTNAKLPSADDVINVNNEFDLDKEISKIISSQNNENLGILLSGGMDSACLASYMAGRDAYTFRFLGGKYQNEELKRAEEYSKIYNLKLHYVDVDTSDLQKFLPKVLETRQAPVHSIEPQIYKAALIAKNEGITKMVIGNAADYVFYGMNKLLAEDWDFDSFVKRYTYLDPIDVLKEPVDVMYLFERYRTTNGIDFIKFMDDVAAEESYSSYKNAFAAANLSYIDPYEKMKMSIPVDLSRVRNGDSKYLVRALFRMKFPNIPVPEKLPMPRPVDLLLADWVGPTRKEFLDNIDMSSFTGNQKWQIFCLERFLDMYEPGFSE